MNVLVIGGGAREHALVAAIKESADARVWCAPGNAGIALVAECVRVQPEDLDSLLTLVKEFSIDLTVVGPENPLAVGIVDRWQQEGHRIFGPTGPGAQLEANKAWAKQFMERHHIPTASYRVFSDYPEARAHVTAHPGPQVIKAAGLAAGKGVVMAPDTTSALEALERIMVGKEFGAAGSQVVVEELLEGEELSVLAITDGETIVMAPPAQDHKRVGDGDQGPNTGGMGAYSPVPQADARLMRNILKRVIEPTVRGLSREGLQYRGVLYAGLMLTSGGIRVLEFNARFGDPEAQVILPRFRGDFLALLDATAQAQLHRVRCSWSDEAAACVVLASQGYPGAYASGLPIQGIEEAEALGARVFHAGTARREGQLVTAGGRVLSVVGLGKDLDSALDQAYAGIGPITFPGMHYRRDIGARARAYGGGNV